MRYGTRYEHAPTPSGCWAEGHLEHVCSFALAACKQMQASFKKKSERPLSLRAGTRNVTRKVRRGRKSKKRVPGHDARFASNLHTIFFSLSLVGSRSSRFWMRPGTVTSVHFLPLLFLSVFVASFIAKTLLERLVTPALGHLII